MCVIAIQPRGIQISKDYLKNCWDNNSHGAGLMYAKDGKIIVKKELESFDKFMSYVEEAGKYDSSLVIHFRIATSGGINDYNIHPFKVHKNLYFCHNGILDIQVPATSKENDTQIFNNNLMKPLPYNFYKNNAIMNVLEFTIGSYNKFVFLDDKGDYYILNEKAGEWSEEGAWFSNTTYKRPKVVYGTYYPKKSYGYDWDDYGWDGRSTYKYNKDAFEVEEVKDVTKLDGPDDVDYCDCCGDVKPLDSVKYCRQWNTWMCPECVAEFDVDSNELFSATDEGVYLTEGHD
jgi:predicted glutamine amidotransferase